MKHNFEKGLLHQFNTRLCVLEAKAEELKRNNVKPEKFIQYHTQKLDINDLVAEMMALKVELKELKEEKRRK